MLLSPQKFSLISVLFFVHTLYCMEKESIDKTIVYSQQDQVDLLLLQGKAAYHGEGVISKDHVAALSCFERVVEVSEQGSELAQCWFYLGRIHLDGVHVKKDIGKALYYLEMVADQNENMVAAAGSWSYLGKYYYELKEFERAYEFLIRIVGQHDNEEVYADACYYLGRMYYFGEAVEVDRTEAESYFLRALTQESNKEAKIAATDFLENFFGSEVIVQKAALDFMRSSNIDETRLATSSGGGYKNSAPEPQKSLSEITSPYLDHSSISLDLRANRALVVSSSYSRTYNASSTPASYGKAIRHDVSQILNKALSELKAEKFYVEGQLYFFGDRAVKKDYAKAFLCFLDCADCESYLSGYAYCYLGIMTSQGWGVSKDLVGAINCFKKAREAGKEEFLKKLLLDLKLDIDVIHDQVEVEVI